MNFTSALEIVTQVRQNNCTIEEAWYGCGMETALRPEHKEDTWDVLLELFADTLTEMNCQHPWMDKRIANRQMERLTEFDAAWTLEDFALFFDMLADGKLDNHYGRPSREWLNKCQVAYNELKYEAREEIARRAKVKAEADAMEAAYTAGLSLPTSENHMEQPRTMAEFLGGKNRLSFAEREAMKQRQKEQSNG